MAKETRNFAYNKILLDNKETFNKKYNIKPKESESFFTGILKFLGFYQPQNKKIIFSPPNKNKYKNVDKYGQEYYCDFNFEKCDTLILSGGALKCIYFLGALSGLKSERIKQFKNYGGTSCGAIVSSLMAVGYTPFEIFKVLLIETVSLTEITQMLEKTINICSKMFLNKGFRPDITFSQLYMETGNKVSFIAFNVTKLKEEILCIENYPNLPVLFAAKLSCSLPMIFPVSRFEDNIFIDGIFYDNFPIKLSKLFLDRNHTMCISTLSSHYDKSISEYYDNPNYKIILIPDVVNKYFLLTKKDKFYMFVTGYNYTEENQQLRKKAIIKTLSLDNLSSGKHFR
ncbi:patatin-like phospholipase [Dasineura jujubifolia toursvirus 2a]|nr:patatin-like phospholipase [Dasineura jujubifolia toursvirus 2a]